MSVTSDYVEIVIQFKGVKHALRFQLSGVPRMNDAGLRALMRSAQRFLIEHDLSAELSAQELRLKSGVE